jgi:dTDP-4-dehydrorhamnose reductase
MKIFLTGKNGQLGYQLEYDLKKSYEVIATDRDTLDLKDTQAIEDIIQKIKPDLIINTAAYTNVDKAENEKDLAYEINALAPKALTKAAIALDIPIIYISTDYIFDGLKKDAYEEEDHPNPLSVYGKTKWQGEEFVRQNPKHFILRTSWVFSSHGHNFLKTIIKLAQEKTSLNIVDDQWGAPTSVKSLSKAIQIIIQYFEQQYNSDIYGTYHVVSKGEINWYLYARQILDILESFKIELKIIKGNIHPIPSSQFPQAAMRPKNSRMNTEKFKNTFMVEFPHWKDEVNDVVSQIIKNLK